MPDFIFRYNAEQATNLKILQPLMGLRHGASLSTHESRELGKDPSRLNHPWGLKQGLFKLKKSDKAIRSPK